jgi:FkbM family methyltransferase
MYHKLLRLTRKFSNRFFLLEELSRLSKKSAVNRNTASTLFKMALNSPSNAEDWIPLHRFLSQLNPLILVDVGANIGNFAFDYASTLPVKHAYLYEPVPQTCEILRKRLDLASFSSTVHNKAVSQEQGSLQFNLFSDSTLNSRHAYIPELTLSGERPLPKNTINVESCPISEKDIEQPGDLFLKIDVQGMELDVVKGCSPILNRCAAVLVEVSFLPEYDNQPPSFAAVTSVLHEYNLEPVFFHQYGDHNSLYAVERDVLFVHRDLLRRAFDTSLNPSIPSC